jgi:hypothetical protein
MVSRSANQPIGYSSLLVLHVSSHRFARTLNPAGRFVNHSEDPNIGFEGATRDIADGEEMTMSYANHADPEWYVAWGDVEGDIN